MEDVLDVYQRPGNPAQPVICLDEKAVSLHSTPQGELPAQPGQPRRQDYEYTREGTAAIFLAVEPLTGVRYTQVRARRTAADFAEVMEWLVEKVYAQAERIVLVTDNLNTHSVAALYSRFPPEQARRLARRIEWHYTPEHGSWLNMAEIELSTLGRQCLARRFPSPATLTRQVQAWQAQRNQLPTHIRWQFTTADARIKLRSLYPEIICN